MINTMSDHFRSTLYYNNINIYSMLLWSILGVYKFCQCVVNTTLTHKYLYFCVLFPLCVCVYASWLSPLVVGYICTCWMKSTLLTVTVHQMFFIQHFVSRLCVYPFVCVCKCVCVSVYMCVYMCVNTSTMIVSRCTNKFLCFCVSSHISQLSVCSFPPDSTKKHVVYKLRSSSHKLILPRQ